jgi:hypothetical protein
MPRHRARRITVMRPEPLCCSELRPLAMELLRRWETNKAPFGVSAEADAEGSRPPLARLTWTPARQTHDEQTRLIGLDSPRGLGFVSSPASRDPRPTSTPIASRFGSGPACRQATQHRRNHCPVHGRQAVGSPPRVRHQRTGRINAGMAAHAGPDGPTASALVRAEWTLQTGPRMLAPPWLCEEDGARLMP